MRGVPRYPTRRGAIRLLGAAALVAPAALRAHVADALHGWCRTDPVVRIGGQVADISLFSLREMRVLATAPAQVVVLVPTGVPTQLIATDPGFGRQGYDVRFEEAKRFADTASVLQVRIKVYAPAVTPVEGALPLRVKFTPRGVGRLSPGTAEGEANSWVILNTP